MTRTYAYKQLAAIKALDTTGVTALAAELERDLLIGFLRDAHFEESADEEICQMILSYVSGTERSKTWDAR